MYFAVHYRTAFYGKGNPLRPSSVISRILLRICSFSKGGPWEEKKATADQHDHLKKQIPHDLLLLLMLGHIFSFFILFFPALLNNLWLFTHLF